METTQVENGQIQEIMKDMACEKDFDCYKSGFENLSKIEIVGDAILIECLEERAKTCKFGLPFGMGYICKCPLRNYIAKHYKI
ncbi:MAG: hypothetical protein FVQ85_03285 [Planctomycetes bacterium]|nr:hypothetical protein [Planctomycetota bacterium]